MTLEIDPALALLAREGISTAGYHSKSWDDLPVTPDIVITVCGSAAGETCPAYLGNVLRTHWGVAQPDHALLMALQRCARPAVGKLLAQHAAGA